MDATGHEMRQDGTGIVLEERTSQCFERGRREGERLWERERRGGPGGEFLQAHDAKNYIERGKQLWGQKYNY